MPPFRVVPTTLNAFQPVNVDVPFSLLVNFKNLNLFIYLGHTMHEMTSYCSMASIFDYVETKRQRPLTEATNNI